MTSSATSPSPGAPVALRKPRKRRKAEWSQVGFVLLRFLCLQVVPGVPALPRAPGSSLAGGPQAASLPTVHPREQSGMAKTEGASTVLTQVAVGRDHSSY